MNQNDYIIRLEKAEDFRKTENLVRESFWNIYRPGCSEHYLLHVMRDDPDFVKELDLVMEKEGQIVGQNVFVRTVIRSDDGRQIPVLTMGPICIAPALKRRGYGRILLNASLERAVSLGYGAVLIEGNIDFYSGSGFGYASGFGIRYCGMPADADTSFFLCRELIPGYLNGVTGVYETPRCYFVDDEEVEVFDLKFPEKEKKILSGQMY